MYIALNPSKFWSRRVDKCVFFPWCPGPAFAQGKLHLHARGLVLLLDSSCLWVQFGGIFSLMLIMWQQAWTKKKTYGSDLSVHNVSLQPKYIIY